mgnify:CR=1 FL=1
MKHFHMPRITISATDLWVFCIIALFTFFIDVVYVISHTKMGIQLSDYWIVSNVIFYGVELVCLTAVNISKKLKPEQKDTYEAIAHEVGKSVGLGIASSISDNLDIPALTSGARAYHKRKRL